MENIVGVKTSCDGLDVDYTIATPGQKKSDSAYLTGEAAVDRDLAEVQEEISHLDKEISRLTCHADAEDYAVAVTSGAICGVVDVFFVGEFSIEQANTWGGEKVNKFVINTANKLGYSGDDLEGAVKRLEKYHIPADSVTNEFGGGTQHHLRDFSHHCSIVGLVFSILTQFTGKVYGTDTAGCFLVVPVPEEKKALIGVGVLEKLFLGTVHWARHLISDMAGSINSVVKGSTGTGIPGPFLSMLKEISALPFFDKSNSEGNREFSVFISKLFNGTLWQVRDASGKPVPLKFDLRTEIGAIPQLGKQAIPILINECIVRGFYFLRRLGAELKDKQITSMKEIGTLDWHNILPFRNRTIVRMLTISTGVMETIDIADAAIKAAGESVGNPALFAGKMMLRINVVGVGRFAIAVGEDVKMGRDASKYRNERMAAYNHEIMLLNAKVWYRQADTWKAADETGQALLETCQTAYRAVLVTQSSLLENAKDLKQIEKALPEAEKKNPGLREEIRKSLI